MSLSRTGNKKNSATFKSNSKEVTLDQMRDSGSKMIRTLASLTRTLDQMPEERTIVMKLLYYDDATPGDYEPSFFQCCAENEVRSLWNKTPLKMPVGSVNSKHLILALKVKSVLDPCDVNSENGNMRLDSKSGQDDEFSEYEIRQSEVDRYVVAPNDGNCEGQHDGSISEDAAHEEALTAQVREWICSGDVGTVDSSDVLSSFPHISMERIEDILEWLLKDGLLSRTSKDVYIVNKIADLKMPSVKKEVYEGTKKLATI